MIEISVGTVFLAALVTALATGLGAVPFAFVPRMSRLWLGISNALAAGLMLAASFSLIQEGQSYSAARSVAGVLLGLAFITLTRQWLDRREPDAAAESHAAATGHDDEPAHDHAAGHGHGHGAEALSLGMLQGADAHKALLIVAVMTVHSFTEGVGVGVSYGGGETLGAFITAAIAVHNIPEGLAICLVLVPRGVAVWRAAWWSVFSSLPQPLMAVPAFLFVEAFQPFLPVGLGFAAGAMIWMVFAELVPEMHQDVPPKISSVVVTLAAAAMIVFQAVFKR